MIVSGCRDRLDAIGAIGEHFALQRSLNVKVTGWLRILRPIKNNGSTVKSHFYEKLLL